MRRPFSRRTRWWLAAVQAVLMFALIALPAFASEPEPLTGPQLIQLLQHYGIVKGDETGNLNLDKPIKRSEMITILVRALGLESEVPFYVGWNAFDDAKGHWAEGYLSLGAVKGLVRGDGNRMVRPEDPVTYAESLTLLLRLVGQEPTTGDWPFNVLVAAAQLGLVPDGITAANVNTPAVRGLVFQSMGKSITTIPMADGRNFLQNHLAVTPPALTVQQPSSPTSSASTRISGTAEGAASVTVNGVTATLTGNSFAADVALAFGNNTITVTATDRAGNKATSTVTIARTHPVVAIEISGPAKVAPGQKATYTLKGTDANGNAISLAGSTASVSGNIGTFDLTSGTLTAADTPAKGKITITAGTVSKSLDVEVMGLATSATRLSISEVNGGRSVAYTKPMTVEVQALDADGELAEDDFGRSVTLTASGLTGVTITPTVAQTVAGIATFTVRSDKMGTVNLQATASGLASGAQSAVFGSNLRVQLSADPTSLVIGSVVTSSRIRATLVDENGNPVANDTGSDIFIHLSTSSDQTGVLIDDSIRIVRGTSSSSMSGDEGLFSVGSSAGSARVSGAITSGQSLTVDPVSISATIPSVGSGSYWDILGNVTMTPGVPSNFSVRLSDARGGTIPGSYAFQLSVKTSNNEKQSAGIPEGLSITFDNGRNPISDGVPEGRTDDGDDVIVRTDSGMADFTITYDKPGEVYITVVPMGATNTAFTSDGKEGSALSSSGISSKTFTLTFRSTPVGLKLVVDSDGLGNDREAGATSNSSSKRFTLRALITDEHGNWIPSTKADIKLERVGAGNSTTPPSVLTTSATDGKATFVVNATSTVGTDQYKVSTKFTDAGPIVQSNVVDLQVQKAVPAVPTILATRGVDDGIPGGLDYLAPSDTAMEIELATDPDQGWVVVKVYREGSSTVLYTSPAINLSDHAPRIEVPKDLLVKGVSRYQVAVRNGYGDSPKSLASNQVTNAQFVTSLRITSAKYQHSTQTLSISGSGFSKNDSVIPGLIFIRDASTDTTIDLGGASVKDITSSQITLELGGTALDDPAQFSGNDVTITAGEGWYVRANGEQSAAITTAAPVTPMAHITHVVYDPTNKRVYLEGAGFSKVNLNTSKMKLVRTDAPATAPIDMKGLSNSRTNDTRWTFTLSTAQAGLLDNNSNYVLQVDDGWAYDGSYTQTGLGDLTLYGHVNITSVSFQRNQPIMTLRGSGFTNGNLTVTNLKVVDLSTGEEATLNAVPDGVKYVSDSQIEITLDFAAGNTGNLNDKAKFQDSDVYLIGEPGWFTNAAQREAAAIPLRTLRLPTLPR